MPEACEECGFENFTGEKYCGGCGVAVAPGIALAPATDAYTPARALPPSPRPAARAAPPPPPAGDAQRRQITVMFCDLVGSTAMSRALDAEDLRDVITEFQQVCAEAIARFDGFVARYMGDGMLVYFGYPKAQEDSAYRAVSAGLAIVDAVSNLGSDPVRRSVRVGIATGRVVIGDLIGEGAAEERAVVGETPNLAARLQSLAKPDTVFVSDSTRSLVGASFEMEDAGTHALKGLGDDVRVWRAVRERTAAQRDPIAQEATPFVGREFELALLADRWKAVMAGQGRAVVLSGDAGSGKTRLVQEAVRRSEAPRYAVLRFRCLRHQRSTMLRPVIDQVSRRAGLEVDDDEVTRRDKVSAWVRRWSPEPQEDLAAMAALLSIPLDEGGLVGGPEEQKAAMLTTMWRSFSRGISANRLWFVFEDVQWADDETLQLVNGLLERAATAAVMVLVTHRSDFQPPWTRAGHVTSLSLGKLPAEQSAELIASLAGDVPLHNDIVSRIIERADGVPAYITELTHAVLASVGSGAHPSSARVVVPATLHDSLAAQLDGLDAGAREVVQVAATIGREFSTNLLRRVYDGGDGALTQALSDLVSTGLVVPPGLGDGSMHTFRHALLCDVAYESLLKRTQRTLHQRIATVLENELPAEAESAPQSLAWHLERGGQPREAATWWRRAAERAADRAAIRDSIAHYRRACAALGGTVDRSVAGESEELAESLICLAAQLRLIGELDEADEHLNAAETLATEHDLTASLSRLWYTRGNLAFRRGDPVACRQAHERALAEAKRGGSIQEMVRALGGLADAHMVMGQYVAALNASTHCIAMADEHGFTRIAAANAPILAFLHYWQLQPKEALAMAKLAIDRARDCNDQRALTNAYHALTQVKLETGDVEGAEQALSELRMVGASTEPFMHKYTVLLTARILRARGDRAGSDAVMRAEMDDSLQEMPLSTTFGIGATATASDDAFHEAIEAILKQITEVQQSHFRFFALHDALDIAMYRRKFDVVARLVETCRPLAESGRMPILDLWFDAMDALLRWHANRDDADARAEVEQFVARGRPAGQWLLALSLQDLLDEHDAAQAASG